VTACHCGKLDLIHQKEKTMKAIIRYLALALLALGAAAVQGQQYPSKGVRIVAPFAPGGGTDFIARLIAKKFTDAMGQPFLVDNKPGAGGNLGAEIGVKSPPDGYTLLLISGSYTVNPAFYKLPFDSAADISAVVQLSQGPFLVAVNPGTPANTLKEFVDLAKKQPEKYSYATAGAGSITHLATEYFLDVAKIKVLHVPYKGTGPALSGAMAGDVQLIFGSVSTALTQAKSGRLRSLAVTTAKRIPGAPDVPTVSEAGFPGFEVVLWHGLIGPKGIPRAIVDKLNKDANTVLQDKEVATLLAQDGVSPAGGTPEQFLATIKSDIERWGKVVKQANIKLE